MNIFIGKKGSKLVKGRLMKQLLMTGTGQGSKCQQLGITKGHLMAGQGRKGEQLGITQGLTKDLFEETKDAVLTGMEDILLKGTKDTLLGKEEIPLGLPLGLPLSLIQTSQT